MEDKNDIGNGATLIESKKASHLVWLSNRKMWLPWLILSLISPIMVFSFIEFYSSLLHNPESMGWLKYMMPSIMCFGMLIVVTKFMVFKVGISDQGFVCEHLLNKKIYFHWKHMKGIVNNSLRNRSYYIVILKKNIFGGPRGNEYHLTPNFTKEIIIAIRKSYRQYKFSQTGSRGVNRGSLTITQKKLKNEFDAKVKSTNLKILRYVLILFISMILLPVVTLYFGGVSKTTYNIVIIPTIILACVLIIFLILFELWMYSKRKKYSKDGV